MKQYLLPIVLLAGSVASAQTKTDNIITAQHKYLFTNQIEYDNIQGGEDPTWDYEYVYDADNKRVKEIRHKRINPEGNAASVKGIIEYAYPADNIIITTERTKDSNNVWQEVSKVKYTYNDEGKIYQILQQEHLQGGIFEDKMQYTFEYNDDGQLSSVLWQEYSQEEDENGQKVSVPSDIHIDNYAYNADGKLIQHQKVSAEDEEPIERRTYTYDGQGQPAGYLWERYDNGNWVKHYEQKVVCEDGNAVEVVEYDYVRGARKREAFMFLSSFDTNIANEEVFKLKTVDDYLRIYENWFENKNAKADERNFSFDYHPIVNDWKAEKTFVNKYKKIEALGVYDITQHRDSISIFPNPTTQYFSLNTKTEKIKVEIYDLAGKLVKSFSNKQDQYDVSSLKTGVYMVVVKGDNVKKSLKLIKN